MKKKKKKKKNREKKRKVKIRWRRRWRSARMRWRLEAEPGGSPAVRPAVACRRGREREISVLIREIVCEERERVCVIKEGKRKRGIFKGERERSVANVGGGRNR